VTGDLDRRLAALARAAELARERLGDAEVAAASAVAARAGARLGLGMETTVVALAGPTGAGKSTLFNALAGAELTQSGVRRPTTSAVTAAVRGDVDPALLDWLGAAARHVLPDEEPGAGFVLLDLPDYDSVEEANRREVERVIALVDLLVWVVDPQKYADAALHDRYLRPLAGHGDVMVLVLNQADRLDGPALEACRADVGRLLAADGLPRVPVVPVSAVEGAGLPELRAMLRARVAARAAAVDRLRADVRRAAVALGGEACAEGRAAGVRKAERERLVAALAGAAGVPVVVGAVARAHRRRGTLSAGWPVARGLARLRPDPLRRLRVEQDEGDDAHSSIPRATPVQRAQADSAVRKLAAAASEGLAPPWPGLVRRAATASQEELPARLDRAVAGTDLGLRRPRWWILARGVQALLALAAAAGALWLLVLVGLGFLQLEDVVPLPEVEGIALPTLLLGGGLLLGLGLAIVARWFNGIGARRRARVAERALRRRVEEVAETLVVAPVEAELALRDELCAELRVAQR